MALNTLAIDPGLRDCGLALYTGHKLVRAVLARSSNKADRGPYAWRDMAMVAHAWVVQQGVLPDVVVIEAQQIYPAKFQKGDQDDILQLAGVGGALAYAFRNASEMYSYLPRIWKGQVPQSVFAKRILSKLTIPELSLIEACPSSLMHNIAHAIGLARYHLGAKL